MIQKKHLEIGLRALVSLAILGFSVAGFKVLTSLHQVNRKSGPPGDAVPLVEVAAVPLHEGSVEFEVTGEVVPYREIVVSSEVAGRAVFVSPKCHIGRTVSKGDTLVQIFRRDYEIEVERLAALKEQAEDSLDELSVEETNLVLQEETARETLELQQRELDRYQEDNAAGVFSPSQVDAARRNVLTAKTALQNLTSQLRTLAVKKEQLAAGLKVAQAQLARAELDRDRTEIKAPISGIVKEHNVELDEYLQKNGPIATIQDMQTLEIRCNLYMKQVHWLWNSVESPGLPEPITSPPSASEEEVKQERSILSFPATSVEVVYELAGRQYQWDGVLESYDGAGVDPKTRMLPVRALVADPFSATLVKQDTTHSDEPAELQDAQPTDEIPSLMAGMFVKIRIRVKPKRALLEIPDAALLPGGEIWLVDQENRLRKRVVAIANSNKDSVLVYQESSGIKPGDRLVVSPMAAPIEGVKVRLADKTTKNSTVPSATGRSAAGKSATPSS